MAKDPKVGWREFLPRNQLKKATFFKFKQSPANLAFAVVKICG
jgi:hypothetical protein